MCMFAHFFIILIFRFHLNVLLEFTNLPPIVTPEAGSGFSTIVFYDPNNEVIKRYF